MINEPLASNSKAVWTGRILSGLIVAFMSFTVVMKIKMRGTPGLVENFVHMGLPMRMLTTITLLEALSVLLYAIPRTSVVGAIFLTGYMGGAICTHLRIGEHVVMQTAIPIVAWLGLYLREPRLRAILPWRS